MICVFDFDTTTANYCKSDFKTHLRCFCGFKRERESPISWRKILWTHWLIRPTTIVLTLSYCASGNASSSHEMVGNYTLYKWVKIRKKLIKSRSLTKINVFFKKRIFCIELIILPSVVDSFVNCTILPISNHNTVRSQLITVKFHLSP